MSNENIIPLSVPVMEGSELEYIKECLNTGWVSTGGEFIERFEEDICKYTGAKYSAACVNGTSGLQVALRILGVKKDDEILVPSLTFIASVNAVKYLGAEPIFMDCDNYMNIDGEKIEDFCKNECIATDKGLKNKKSGKIIKAIVPVHIFGNPADMAAIIETGKKYNLKVVEDGAESTGSYYTEGIYKNRFTGTIGDIGVYSFNGNKIITTGGGGMIVTNNKIMAERAKYLTTQAKDDGIRYVHNEIGYNFRMTNISAAMGVAQLKDLEKRIEIKKKNYELYRDYLQDVRGIELLGIPKGTRPNYWFYSIIVDREKYGMSREELMLKFAENGIQTRPVWYPGHLQKPYIKNEHYKIEKTMWFWEKVLNIPCSSNLSEGDIKTVVSVIKK